ncbi:hypothetical protein SprV_0200587500 [Sparganum proliferum]
MEVHLSKIGTRVQSFMTDETGEKIRDIHIAQVIFGVDQCRAEVLTLKSILRTWKSKSKHDEMQKLHLHIICDAKSRVIMNTMLRTWQLKDVNFDFYVIPNYKEKTAWMNSWHYAASIATLRLYLPEILSNDTKKVISLDTDVIFLDDISELWDLIYEADKNQGISMAWDESMTYSITFRSEDTIVLKGGYNGGVLLLHLDRLRQRGWTELWRSALDALLKVSSVLRAAEQDILNVLIWMHKDLFYPLPCVWNLQLNDAANGSACLHSRSLVGLQLAERPNAKLLHMNRQDKFEYRDDDYLTPADVPATEITVNDRLQWYLVERKKVTLLNGYNFVDTTAQLSRGELEKVFQQIHTNAKFPTGLPFCTENMDIQEFCVKAASTSHVPRTHVYFVDRSENQELQTRVGTSLVVLANVDSIPRLSEISKLWRGPISVAMCASDRQAFRLPLLLSWSTGLSVRRDIIFHTVYAYEDTCFASFAHNVAVAFSLTSHVLILKDGAQSNDQGLLPAIEKSITLDKTQTVGQGKHTAFVFVVTELNETNTKETSEENGRSIPHCRSKDNSCKFRLLRRASAVLLPTETALVPLEAAADSIFELLVWNLLGAFPDAYTVVTLSTTSRADARGHV